MIGLLLEEIWNQIQPVEGCLACSGEHGPCDACLERARISGALQGAIERAKIAASELNVEKLIPPPEGKLPEEGSCGE